MSARTKKRRAQRAQAKRLQDLGHLNFKPVPPVVMPRPVVPLKTLIWWGICAVAAGCFYGAVYAGILGK